MKDITNLLKWGYTLLAAMASITLAISLFVPEVSPINQMTLLMQSVCFGWLSGAAFNIKEN